MDNARSDIFFQKVKEDAELIGVDIGNSIYEKMIVSMYAWNLYVDIGCISAIEAIRGVLSMMKCERISPKDLNLLKDSLEVFNYL